MEAAAIPADHGHHHGPPEANRSSRVEPQMLGMLLFIISEVMVFGAFFTAYFFIRVVNHDHWFLINGVSLPKAVAGLNTLILVSSSTVMPAFAERLGASNLVIGAIPAAVPHTRAVPIPGSSTRPPRKPSRATPAQTARTMYSGVKWAYWVQRASEA